MHEDAYDSGDYSQTLDRVLKEARWAEKAKLQGTLVDGRYHGLAVGCFIEGGAAGPKEMARLEINDDGSISVYMGSSAVGQGVETVFAQIAADALEIPMDRIRWVHHGSTAYVSDGYGAYHSRSIVMGGSALLDAADNFKAALSEDAAKRLGCEASEIALNEDKVTGAGRQVAAAVRLRRAHASKARSSTRSTPTATARRWRMSRSIRRPAMSTLIDYVVVQDAGRIINPLTLNGQVIGSLVQGLGGAFLENLVYDAEGQLLTGSLADYLLPTASDFPNPARLRDGRASVADQSARCKRRGRGRHGRRRRRDRQCGRQRAAVVQARLAGIAADPDAGVGDGAEAVGGVSAFDAGDLPNANMKRSIPYAHQTACEVGHVELGAAVA